MKKIQFNHIMSHNLEYKRAVSDSSVRTNHVRTLNTKLYCKHANFHIKIKFIIHKCSEC